MGVIFIGFGGALFLWVFGVLYVRSGSICLGTCYTMLYFHQLFGRHHMSRVGPWTWFPRVTFRSYADSEPFLHYPWASHAARLEAPIVRVYKSSLHSLILTTKYLEKAITTVTPPKPPKPQS